MYVQNSEVDPYGSHTWQDNHPKEGLTHLLFRMITSLGRKES
jgi:hypothetical protein